VQAHLLDVGAGASTLADHLLEQGYQHLTLLDISATALDITRQRLAVDQRERVQWLVGDITSLELPVQRYDLWHDRAVFHFLTDDVQRQRYIEQVRHALRPNGHVIIATFASDGPTQCSGLDIVQYEAHTLAPLFGDDFTLEQTLRETHITPWESVQHFNYFHFRKTENA
jgi:SAM-dependent methyltransferase